MATTGRRACSPGWLAALAAATCLTLPGTTPAQTTVEVKPLVMLLLDTSGSMEYSVAGNLLETEDQDVLLVPDCTLGQRSRFIVATEVLTGTYGGYYCTLDTRDWPPSREDHGYPVPHVVPHGVQLPDGLIDMTLDRFKFGVMTFDAIPSDSENANGGYSYGPERGVNLGARNDRNPANGRFVPPEPSDDPDSVAARNLEVQASILSAIPYGGTPIAPMLRDALYFFQNDPSQQPWDPDSREGDRYLECRSRNIILVSDGRANMGEGTDGYLTSVEYAQQLRDLGIRVHVIGFQLPAGVSTQMNAIAQAGGTNEAILADTTGDLVAALVTILGSLESYVQSRTRVVVTDDTGHRPSPGQPEDLQYQFNAGYGMVPDVPGLRQGFLERTVYRCAATNSTATAADVQAMHKVLSATSDSSRSIYTVVRGQMTPFDEDHVVPADLGVTETSGWLMDFRPTNEGLCRAGVLGNASDPSTGEATRNLFRDILIDYIRARQESCRAGYKLGAIVHSTPAVLGHLRNVDISMPSFKLYKQSETFQGRPALLFVGSHDGMLHAFRIDRGVESEWGREQWAFIPGHLLKRLKDLPGRYVPLFDGSPVVRDVLMYREPEPDGSMPAPEVEATRWRAVLVAGYGHGGRGYVALDVTDGTPKFLWEISNEGRCVRADPESNPQDCFDNTSWENDFRRLGWTTSRPDIGVVHSYENGVMKQYAVAVFGGGSGTGLEPGAGKSVFVVRLSDGAKVAEFPRPSGVTGRPGQVDDSCSSTAGTGQFDAPMTGSVTCYQTFPGTFISRCFLGDAAGQLWRVDLGSPCPVGCTIGTQSVAGWSAQFFYDPYHAALPAMTAPERSPVFEAPALTTRPYSGELIVAYGGADTDQLDEITHKNFVAAVQETRIPMATTEAETLEFACTPRGRCTARTGYLGSAIWQRFFGYRTIDLAPEDQYPGETFSPGERLMGPPTIFSNSVYFTTFTPDLVHPCRPGIGRLWGVDVLDRGTSGCASFLPRLDDDPRPDFGATDHMKIGGSAGAIPFGVTVAMRPSCSAGQSFDQAAAGSEGGQPLAALSPRAPSLIVQTGLQSAATQDTMPTVGGVKKVPDVASMTREVVGFIQSLFVGAWGFVFD